jgi:hypothetical protein
MTAAYRLRGLGWFATCSAIVLGFYLVSLQVASERNRLEALNGRIRVAERDIRALETEFDTRANLAQLEKWNGEILALSAPVAAQFVPDQAALASVRFDRAPGDAEMRLASLVVPSLPTPAPAPEQAAMPAQASVQPAIAARAVVVAQAASVAQARPRTVALLEKKLLSENTIGDLLAGARAEAGRNR